MKVQLQRLGIGGAKAVGFLLALNVFFVAIKLLGAFKGLGSGYGETLIQELAQNPFIGLLIGIMITSIIQSSSTTTSITVGLVAAGVMGDDSLEALRLAIPIIMGANIGTSITATIVSMGQMGNRIEFERAFRAALVHDVFNWLTVLVLLPLQVATNFLGHTSLLLAEALDDAGGLKFTSPIKYVVDPQYDLITGWFKHSEALIQFVVLGCLVLVLFQACVYLSKRVGADKSTTWVTLLMSAGVAGTLTFAIHFRQYIFDSTTATFLTGLGMLFAALWALVTIMRSVVLDRVQDLFSNYIFKTAARAMLMGMLITALVQSSSVTTSLMVPLAGAGLLTLVQILPYTIGANIGTTITAILAALSLGDVTGIAVAFAHLLFNLCGMMIFWPLRRIPLFLARKMAKAALISPAIPILVVVLAYILVPLGCILIFR
jgi:sodium-dependent phosphate cotransporter